MQDREVENKIDEILESIKNCSVVISQNDFYQTYHSACALSVDVKGLWMEFGVYRGTSISNFAKFCPTTIYGFDSFEGLPETWDDDNKKGTFSLNGKIPMGFLNKKEGHTDPGMYSREQAPTLTPWPKNVSLIKGWFDDSLPTFLKNHSEKAAFVHIDSDIYSSAVTILSCLEEENRFQSGTIVAFDELCDYPDYREHEIKAFAEFLIKTGYKYNSLFYAPVEIDGQTSTYNSACFEIIID